MLENSLSAAQQTCPKPKDTRQHLLVVKPRLPLPWPHFSILFCQCHPSASWSLPPLFQSLGIWPISPTTIPSFTAHVRIHLIKWPLTPQVLISRTLLQVIHSSAHALTGCCITRNSSIFRIPDANNLCTSLLPLLLSCSPDIVLQPHSDFSFLHQP